MTTYQRIARIEIDKDAVAPSEDFESINAELNDHKIMEVVHEDPYLVQQDDDGDVHLIGEIDDEIGGDYWASTDEVAEKLNGTYKVVSFPLSNRYFAYVDKE